MHIKEVTMIKEETLDVFTGECRVYLGEKAVYVDQQDLYRIVSKEATADEEEKVLDFLTVFPVYVLRDNVAKFYCRTAITGQAAMCYLGTLREIGQITAETYQLVSLIQELTLGLQEEEPELEEDLYADDSDEDEEDQVCESCVEQARLHHAMVVMDDISQIEYLSDDEKRDMMSRLLMVVYP